MTKAVAATAEAGYDVLELAVLDPSSVDAPFTRDLLAEHGLRAACSLGLEFETDVSSGHPEVMWRGREKLAAALDVAAGIGADFLGGVVYSALAKYPGPPRAINRAHAVESLRELADRAGERDVTIGLEVVNRYETNVLNTAEQALDMIDEIGADNMWTPTT